MTRKVELLVCLILAVCLVGVTYIGTGKLLQGFAQKLQVDLDNTGQIVDIYLKDHALSPASYSALKAFQDQGYSLATTLMMSKFRNDTHQRDTVFVEGVLNSQNFQTFDLLMSHKSLFDEAERQRLVLSAESPDILPLFKASMLHDAQSTLSPKLQQEMGRCLAKLTSRYTRLFVPDEITLAPIMIDRLMGNRVCEFSVDA